MKYHEINKISEHKTVVDGKVLIDEVNDLFGLDIQEEEMDTIGGWILSEKMDVVEGDKVKYGDYEFKVLEIDGYHIKSLEIVKMLKNESIA